MRLQTVYSYTQVLKSKITFQVGIIMVFTKAINFLNVSSIIRYYVYLFLLVLQSHQVHAGRFSLFLVSELKLWKKYKTIDILNNLYFWRQYFWRIAFLYYINNLLTHTVVTFDGYCIYVGHRLKWNNKLLRKHSRRSPKCLQISARSNNTDMFNRLTMHATTVNGTTMHATLYNKNAYQHCVAPVQVILSDVKLYLLILS